MKGNEIIKSIEDAQIKEVADFNVGDTIKVYAKIKEGNRERIQAFEGTVLKRQGGSCRETFPVRKKHGHFIAQLLIRLKLSEEVKLGELSLTIFVTELVRRLRLRSLLNN